MKWLEETHWESSIECLIDLYVKDDICFIGVQQQKSNRNLVVESDYNIIF